MSDDLGDLAGSFARHLKAEGKAERTRVLYLQSIRFYGRWLEAQGIPATLDNLTLSLIHI